MEDALWEDAKVQSYTPKVAVVRELKQIKSLHPPSCLACTSPNLLYLKKKRKKKKDHCT